MYRGRGRMCREGKWDMEGKNVYGRHKRKVIECEQTEMSHLTPVNIV